MTPRMIVAVMVVAAALGGCGAEGPAAPGFDLTSAAFEDGSGIPVRYTCDGENISPPLAWGEAPPGTQSLVLIMDDPDARGWVHWVIYNIPGTTRRLAEGVGRTRSLPLGGLPGRTSAGVGYHGPCPPPHDGPHRYVFRLYALRESLDLPAEAEKAEVEASMRGRVLATAKLTGTYARAVG